MISCWEGTYFSKPHRHVLQVNEWPPLQEVDKSKRGRFAELTFHLKIIDMVPGKPCPPNLGLQLSDDQPISENA